MAVLADSIDGNGIYAMRAEADKDGNRIDLTYAKRTDIPAAQVQADWAESDSSDPSYIQNKPDLSVYATDSELTAGLATKQDTLTAGSNITITNNVISATAAPQEQADWTQSDTTAVDYIKHKPTLAAVATSGSYNDLSNTPSIPSVGFIDL